MARLTQWPSANYTENLYEKNSKKKSDDNKAQSIYKYTPLMFLNPFQKTKLIPNNAPRNIKYSFSSDQNPPISFCSSRL